MITIYFGRGSTLTEVHMSQYQETDITSDA